MNSVRSMDRVTRLLRNTSFLLLAALVKPFVSFFFIVAISRILGVEGIGQYTVILTFVSFFEILGTLGLTQMIVRGVAVTPHEAGKYATNSLLLGVAVSLAATLLLLLLLALMRYPPGIDAGIKILAASILLYVLTEYTYSIMEGLQRMGLKSSIIIGEAVARVSFGITAVYLGYGVTGIIWATVLTRLLICGISLFLLTVKLEVKPTSRMDAQLSFGLLRQSMTFLLITFVSTAYWSLDVLMLSKMKGALDVGIYTAAYRVMDIIKNLSYSYIVAMFPMISLSFTESKASFERDCEMSIKYLFLLTFPATLGIYVLAERIITLIYGAEFIESILTLRILIWTVCLFPLALVFSKALIASHHQKVDLIAITFGLTINIVANFFLIPPFGFNGAAIATVVSILFFLLIQYSIMSRLEFRVPLLTHLKKPFIAGILMAGVAYFFKDTNLVFAVAVPVIVYILVLFLLGTFTPQELEKLQNIWNRALKRMF